MSNIELNTSTMPLELLCILNLRTVHSINRNRLVNKTKTGLHIIKNINFLNTKY